MISCREVVNLASLTKLQIVAGHAGLNRLVRWVHFIDLPDVLPWVQGGELLIITGIGLQGDTEKLRELVRGIINKKLAGLIINVGPYIEDIPAEVLQLADQAHFPIFALPWEVKIIEVTRDICSHIVRKQTEERSIKDFLEQLLFFPLADPEVLIQRAAYYGYDLARPHQVAVISPRNLTEYLEAQKLKDENALMAFKMRFGNVVQDILARWDRKILQTLCGDDIVLLMPYDSEPAGVRQNLELLTRVWTQLVDEMPELAVTVAVGGRFAALPEARRSYLEASRVLRLFGGLRRAARPVYAYERLGIYKLLFEIGPEKLALYYQEIIEPLHEYDRRNNTELIDTLFAYFEENCNAAQTAKRLFVHRNTLDYRLKKIEEISGRDLDDPYDRLTLQLGVIMGKQMDSSVFSLDLPG
ncbi:PucR family transcriptional regulator [Propionispora vibrioides]|uniref:PucR C-terminal helix-turn-helix domain-containing protein n=1 Tax=Propionispora vibrioides TaxID=112903 RepID=A0A1H8VXB1_9FIRM|nr:PucR family transcriptional regulator [Propionispora vibrioides]SEP20082.1 PucR C-terminal helix-turn-helix domain-containing protein [Propionispora vibrioides]